MTATTNEAQPVDVAMTITVLIKDSILVDVPPTVWIDMIARPLTPPQAYELLGGVIAWAQGQRRGIEQVLAQASRAALADRRTRR